MITVKPTQLENITYWAPEKSCASLQILRLDQLHPVVSGNKWFKLRYQLEAATAAGRKTLLSFGGGFSNHLIALAFAGRENGFSTVGIVRGNYPDSELTPTLKSCREFGMELQFLDKSVYDALSHSESTELQARFPDAFIIPEGGANLLGQRGAAAIAKMIPAGTTDVCVSVGTGTTLAGLFLGLKPSVRLHGYCAAANCDAAKATINSRFLANNLRIYADPETRFGKWSTEQLEFMKQFFKTTGIPLDVVYTGKMMMLLEQQLKAGKFPPDASIVCIHTGGLQGNPEGLFD